ncbi:MAG: homocysteine S-methyltransferase family protein [Acidiferrobacterales bacterium]
METKLITGPSWLHERIEREEIIILDGATGTELQRRGVLMHDIAWSGIAVSEHGDVVRSVHEDYIRAGADVIITNTFAGARHLLEPAGFGDNVEIINRGAVEIARQARENAADHPVAIAGSMSDFMASQDPDKWLRPSTLRATYREQADILAEAGVDLIALEMMQKPEVAAPAVEAAVATGLPVWIGCSCQRIPNESRLALHDYPDRDFSELLDTVVGMGGAVMTVMHSDVTDTNSGLAMVRERWSGPLGAYPNSGYFVMPNWQFVDIISPEDLVTEAKRWIAQGLQLIGGCCGIGPAHIALLKQQLPSRLR